MEIRVLGPLEAVGADGAVVALGGRQRRLLAALVIARGEVCSPEALAEAIWSGAPPSSAAKVLQVYVSRLRRALPDGIRIQTVESGYAAEYDADALDSARFERLVDEAKLAARDGNGVLAVSLFERAESLWRGSAYGDLAYEDLARSEAERLEELRLHAVEERIEAELGLGRHADVLPRLGGLTAAHPLRERLCGQVMRALYRAGRQADALEAFTSLHRRLHDELGLEPGPELRQLQRQILEHDPELVVGAARQGTAIALPVAPNELLGRERELNELSDVLGRARLVVLTGAGGSGKTRLALEVARRAAGTFANGAALADLTAVRKADLVPAAIAAALGVLDASADDPMDALVDALRSQELLLMVDNAEHVRDAAPHFVELLRWAPRLRLLVTSRVVLHVSGEYVYPVEPLAAEPAVALFSARSQEANPRFRPDAADADVMRRICTRLEGLPLAIELAAGWIRALTASELLDQLERHVPLLTGAPRDLPARQRTMRATVAWSFDLLADDERRDLCRLSVFAGGWTLDAAEAVCGTTLHRLSSLVDHSLVRPTSGPAGSRYSMLETVREFAFESLEQRGEAAAVSKRHADFLLALGEAVDRAAGADREPLLQRLRPELDNLRAAMRWALQFDVERALRLGWVAWYFQAGPQEQLAWLDEGLARAGVVRRDVRARAVHGAAVVTGMLSEHGRSRELWDQALELYGELGDQRGISRALSGLGFLAEADADIDEARRLYERGLALSRELDDWEGEWIVLQLYGQLERAYGERIRAVELMERAVAVTRASDDLEAVAMSMQGLADAERAAATAIVACGRYQETIEIARQLAGGRRVVCSCLAGLACIAASSKQSGVAGLLWGAVESLEEQVGRIYPPAVRAEYRGPLDELDPAAVACAMHEGRTLAFEDVVEFALGLDPRSLTDAARSNDDT